MSAPDREAVSWDPGWGSFSKQAPNARRRVRWFLLAGVLAVAAIVGLLLTRAFQRPDGSPASGDAELVVPDRLIALLESPPKETIEDLRSEATGLAAELVDDLPAKPEAVALAAYVHIVFGGTTEARNYLERCLELDPTFAGGHYGMGWLALQKGEYEEAESWLRRAVALSPNLDDAREKLVEALMCQGKMVETVSLLEMHLDGHSATARILIRLGYAYLHLKDYQQAKRSYLAAIELDPSETEAYYGLFRACVSLGQGDEAEAYQAEFQQRKGSDRQRIMDQVRIENSVAAARRFVAEFYFAVSRLYSGEGELEKAEECCLKAAAVDPESTTCREVLASLYEQSSREQEALFVCQQLAELDPENADYWLNVAILNAQLNRFDAARCAAHRAVELNPDDPRCREAYEVIREGE